MNYIEFEENLYNLLINHINEKYEIDKYIELLNYEPNNSLLIYLTSHAYFKLGDLKSSDEYRLKAVKLNSNIGFDTDFEKIFIVIYYLFSTITTKYNPYLDDEIECDIKSDSTPKDYLLVSEKYRNSNDLSNSIRIIDKAQTLFPEDKRFICDRASTLLFSREIDEAWKNNEIRFDDIRCKLPQYADKPKFILQKNSAKVYVYTVTKLGDAIFFARYIFELKKRYPKLKLFVNVDENLYDLFTYNKIPIYKNIDKKNMDYQISFEGLPTLFQGENLILSDKYLNADKKISNEYKQKYFNNGKLKIGIVWNSSEKNNERNINITDFIGLFNISGIQYYSLQKNVTLQEQIILARNNVVTLGEKFENLNQTAAAIDNLDFVIGCDTSVTNLSGAMGKNTIILLPYHSDWRWGVYEQSCKWYKSVKLYRQNLNKRYDEVFERIERELKKLYEYNKT